MTLFTKIPPNTCILWQISLYLRNISCFRITVKRLVIYSKPKKPKLKNKKPFTTTVMSPEDTFLIKSDFLGLCLNYEAIVYPVGEQVKKTNKFSNVYWQHQRHTYCWFIVSREQRAHTLCCFHASGWNQEQCSMPVCLSSSVCLSANCTLGCNFCNV